MRTLRQPTTFPLNRALTHTHDFDNSYLRQVNKKKKIVYKKNETVTSRSTGAAAARPDECDCNAAALCVIS